MTRPMAAMAVLCLTLAGCPEPKEEAVAPVTPETEVVGQQVSRLSEVWLQGEASVQGTQLVVFFELWCPHCRREVPRLQQLQRALGDQGLQVVGLTRLSRGVTEEQLMTFVGEQGLTYPIGRTPDGLAQQLEVQGIPAAAVLKDGVVVWRGHPARLDEAQLAAWLL